MWDKWCLIQSLCKNKKEPSYEDTTAQNCFVAFIKEITWPFYRNIRLPSDPHGHWPWALQYWNYQGLLQGMQEMLKVKKNNTPKRIRSNYGLCSSYSVCKWKFHEKKKEKDYLRTKIGKFHYENLQTFYSSTLYTLNKLKNIGTFSCKLSFPQSIRYTPALTCVESKDLERGQYKNYVTLKRELNRRSFCNLFVYIFYTQGYPLKGFFTERIGNGYVLFMKIL